MTPRSQEMSSEVVVGEPIGGSGWKSCHMLNDEEVEMKRDLGVWVARNSGLIVS